MTLPAIPEVDFSDHRHLIRKSNWLEPRKYLEICHALQETNFNSRAAVKYLQATFTDPPVYATLTHSTVETFFTRERDGDGITTIVWNKSKADKARQGFSNYTGGTGRIGVLVRYPAVKNEIVQLLRNVRETGAVLNSAVIFGLIHGVIQGNVPDLL
jgi:hypothetical protein